MKTPQSGRDIPLGLPSGGGTNRNEENVDMTLKESYEEIRHAVRDLCSRFPGAYWRKVDDSRGYPEEFVKALTDAGWLAALIPEEYGGSGLGVTEASVILEEVNRSGGNSGTTLRCPATT